MGGEETVLTAIRQALDSQDYQWGIVLADLLIATDPSHKQAKKYKAQGLMSLGHMETSANGRHYYLACAKELLAELKG
ncbi:alkyl sulfatase dimerization domain-containing protein [Desulfitobacterium dehalogenans]|uniref:alkyl sulfatase dimerization domain-containing protein n=1 Tax=Desulfitobacterium dehalogenans TaxID=36854 RepID=UPI0002498606|nr:alkyl sulfatase dimerization domain-containing protein [Desulfitobacterium dehalogenans]